MITKKLVNTYLIEMEELLAELGIIIGLNSRKKSSSNIILRKHGDPHTINLKRLQRITRRS